MNKTTIIAVVIFIIAAIGVVVYFANKSNYTIYHPPPSMDITVDPNALKEQYESSSNSDAEDGKEGYVPPLGKNGNFEDVNPIIPYEAARKQRVIHRPLEVKWPGRATRSELLINAQANKSLGFGMGANPYLNYIRDQDAESEAINKMLKPK